MNIKCRDCAWLKYVPISGNYCAKLGIYLAKRKLACKYYQLRSKGMTWVVWRDFVGKWHAYRRSWISDMASDEATKQEVKNLVESPIEPLALQAYCIHAPTRSRAFSLARKAEKARALAGYCRH
jgi:hypothetical protein